MRKPSGVALLTIRAWCEEGSEQPLRVEIRSTDDVANGFGSTVTLIRVGGVLNAVREFLDCLPCPALEDPHVTAVSRPSHG